MSLRVKDADPNSTGDGKPKTSSGLIIILLLLLLLDDNDDAMMVRVMSILDVQRRVKATAGDQLVVILAKRDTKRE